MCVIYYILNFNTLHHRLKRSKVIFINFNAFILNIIFITTKVLYILTFCIQGQSLSFSFIPHHCIIRRRLLEGETNQWYLNTAYRIFKAVFLFFDYIASWIHIRTVDHLCLNYPRSYHGRGFRVSDTLFVVVLHIVGFIRIYYRISRFD